MSDDDLSRRSGLMTLAGFALAFGGIAFVASALQLFSLFSWSDGLIDAAVYLQLALGAAAAFTGFVHTQGRGWASDAGIGLGAALVLGGGAWIVWAIFLGTFTLLSLFAVALAGMGTLLVVLARPEVKRVHAAREALMKELSEP